MVAPPPCNPVTGAVRPLTMRHLAAKAGTIGAGVLLLLGTACANSPDDQVGPGSGPSLPRATSTSAPDLPSLPPGPPPSTPPAGATAVPDAQVDASALPDGYPRMVWTEQDGRAVGAVAQEGGCGKASAEAPEQSADRVVVTLVETQPSQPQPCTMDLRYPTVNVSLDAPLGDRKVVLRAEQRKG
jgi:hypothetical protein